MSKVTIEKIKEFNRFYTSIIGVTNNHILQSDFSLTEARVMFETDKNPGITARQLKEILQVDEGYLSRIVTKLVNQKILVKRQSKEDKRIFALQLSERGKQIFTKLDQRSNEDVEKLIQPLSSQEQEKLCKLLSAVKTLLKKKR